MPYASTPILLSIGAQTSHSYTYGDRSAFYNGQKAVFLERPENRFFRLLKA